METRIWLTTLGLALAGLASGIVPPPGDEPGPLRICLVSGSEEYESDRTLAAYKEHLEANYPVRCTLLKAEGTDRLPGLEALDDCDVALFFTRRLTIDGEALERVKRYATSGRPIVGVRTASHGFQNWLEMDGQVFGGNYRGHYGNETTQRATAPAASKDHPVLKGVGRIASRGSLYKTSPLADDATLLLSSTSPEATEPAAWAREVNGGRVFYTSLGAQGDFENAAFLRLLTNGLFWAAGRDVPEPPAASAQPPLRPEPSGTLTLTLRSQAETAPGSGQFETRHERREVSASKVAIVICDMWDRHWCRGATGRCDAIAARMEPVVASARAAGVQIVHAPSDCMDFYEGTPQRLRARLAPEGTPLPPRPGPADEPPLPIDDSDGGCDTDDAMYLAWTRQNARIGIGEHDAISDDGDEVYNLLRQLGVDHVIVMGVHTNMCVLNRGFAIRAMTRRGMDCVLVRDLTDTMYDPKDPPHVSHDEGTALVVGHIEKYWAPTTHSAELMEACEANRQP